MSPSERIDYELLTLTIDCEKDWGYETRPPELRQAVAAKAPDMKVTEVAIIDRCKVLFLDQLLDLRKRDGGGGFGPYAGGHEDDEFFWRGDFYLKRTPRSREHLEKLAKLIEPEEPPTKHYGFQP